MDTAVSSFKIYALLISTFILCLGLHYTPGAEELLRFDRQLVLQGEWWRILTCNFVHLNDNHLWMDMIGLILVGAVFWKALPQWTWLCVVLLSSLAVGFGVLWFSLDLHWYVGISGVLHGMIAAGAIADIRDGYKSSGFLLLAVVLKLAYEQIIGPVPGSESALNGRVAVDAHLYGMLGGLCAFFAKAHSIQHGVEDSVTGQTKD